HPPWTFHRPPTNCRINDDPHDTPVAHPADIQLTDESLKPRDWPRVTTSYLRVLWVPRDISNLSDTWPYRYQRLPEPRLFCLFPVRRLISGVVHPIFAEWLLAAFQPESSCALFGTYQCI